MSEGSAITFNRSLPGQIDKSIGDILSPLKWQASKVKVR